MNREEIEKAANEWNWHECSLIDFAISCCARQAEEDAKKSDAISAAHYKTNADLLRAEKRIRILEARLSRYETIRAKAPTRGELSRTKVDK